MAVFKQPPEVANRPVNLADHSDTFLAALASPSVQLALTGVAVLVTVVIVRRVTQRAVGRKAAADYRRIMS